MKRTIIWFKKNNFVVENYIEDVICNSSRRYSTMHCVNLIELRFLTRFDILISDDAYDAKTRNENFKYCRLSKKVDFRMFNRVIDKSHSNLKILIFFVLYFESRDHFQRELIFEKRFSKNTLFKNVQHKLNMTISHFRNDWYWFFWMYLKMKELRIHQNSFKIIKNANKRREFDRLIISDFIIQSVYDNWSIIDENQTSSISIELRIESYYFQLAQRKIDTLTKTISLFQIFLTLTFFEKWMKYQKILKDTNEENITLNNRFWKTVQYYHYRWLFFKKYLLRKSNVSNYEKLKNLMKRQEFQNRDVIHIHSLLWMTMSIAKFITKNYIRADVSNSKIESKLYKLVREHQVHICRDDFCKKNLIFDVQICRKKFSIFFFAITHRVDDNLRYIYKRTKKKNRWVFFYNAVIFMIWKTHINVQYCIFDDLFFYVNKYVTKSKFKKLYDKNDDIQNVKSHILNRRMKSMKIMMFFLNYEIFRCFKKITYLITARSNERFFQIKSFWILMQKQFENEDCDFFYKNAIEKYFDKFFIEKFENFFYFEYNKNYKIDIAKKSSFTVQKKQSFRKKKSMLIKTIRRRFCDENVFFYERLFHQHHWRFENELFEVVSTNEVFQNYRNYFVTRWSTEYTQFQKWHINKIDILKIDAKTFFFETFERIASHELENQSQVIRNKLQQMRENLKSFLTNIVVLDLKKNQLTTYNYITTQFFF